MNLPEYISVKEVKRVCQELGLQDWTALTEATVTAEELARSARTETAIFGMG